MKRVLALIIPYIIIVGIFQVIGTLLAGGNIANLNAPHTAIQEMIISIFTCGGTALLLYLFMKYIDEKTFINLGFQIKGRKNDILVGLGLPALFMVIGYIVLISLDQISYMSVSFKALDMFSSVVLFIAVALTEEMLFRGYILRNLMRSYNKYLALAISSVLFALMHGVNPNISWFSMIDLTLAGLALGISYIYTKNLWFPIAFHFSWNFIQSHLGFNVSGQDFYSMIETSFSSETLLNGGAFGFEGSILSIIAELLTIAFVMYYYKRHKIKNA